MRFNPDSSEGTDRQLARRFRIARRSCAPALLTLLTACGLPDPPDVRGEMASAIVNLGVRPIYPLRENFRLGSLFLTDETASAVGGTALRDQVTSIPLSNSLVAGMERLRAAAPARFPQSSSSLATQLQPTTGSPGHFQQGPPTQGNRAEEGALSLAALPGYTLASVDQGTLAAYVPQAIASFFAAIGLRHTRFLRMEALGVELADLPLDELMGAVAAACAGTGDVLGNGGRRARQVVRAAVAEFEAARARRVRGRIGRGESKQQAEAAEATVRPLVHLPYRVFYLRGIRFVVEDTRAAAAFVQTAVANRLPAGVSAPAPASVTIANTISPSGSSTAASNGIAARDAEINRLQAALDGLRTSMAQGTATQIAASAARATARGIELTEVFDRPLAFGYQSVATPLPPHPAATAEFKDMAERDLQAVCRSDIANREAMR